MLWAKALLPVGLDSMEPSGNTERTAGGEFYLTLWVTHQRSQFVQD